MSRSTLQIKQILFETISSMRENLQIFAYFALIFAIGNYIFIKLENINKSLFWPHLLMIYAFYYAFIRVYFNQKPIFEKNNFIHTAAKMIVIVLLAFASVMFLRLGFELMKFFAKSLIIFPDIYNFLADIYVFLKTWPYTNVFLLMFLFAVLLFTMFIPFFAWISAVIGKEQSIIFSVLETKAYYVKLFAIYFVLYAVMPIILTGIMINLGFPLILMCIISAIFSIFQLVFYLKIYLSLFPLSVIK